MAISLSTLITLLATTTLVIAHRAVVDAAANITAAAPTLPEVLVQYGLPSGLIPETVKSYSLSHNGELEVELEQSCCIVFFELIYQAKIRGKLSYGEISDVSGMEVMRQYLWMPVTGIKLVHSVPAMVEFQVKLEFLSVRYPASSFTDYFPTCSTSGRCYFASCDGSNEALSDEK